jgi:streptogramin lyase
VRIDAGNDKVVQTVGVGNDPDSVALSSGRVWVANFSDGTVSRIDPTTSDILTIPVNGTPLGLAVHAGVVFVVNGPPANSLTLINTTSGNAYDLVSLRNAAASGTAVVAAGRSGVWLGDNQTATLAHVDPSPAQTKRVRIAARLPLRRNAELNGLAVGADDVWAIGNSLDRRLWRVDSRTGRILAVTRLPIAPRRVALGAGAVWVTGEVEDVLLRIDPRTARVVDRFEVGAGASGVAVGAGSVWVADSIAGTVERVDPRSGQIETTIDVGGSPNELAVAGEDVWVTRSLS